MTLDEFQSRCLTTAIYPDRGGIGGLTYCTMGLAGEAGEVCGKVKKIVRDCGGVMTDPQRVEIGKELGDTLYYVAMAAHELGLNLGDVAHSTAEKLRSRMERGVLGGSGDNR